MRVRWWVNACLPVSIYEYSQVGKIVKHTWGELYLEIN